MEKTLKPAQTIAVLSLLTMCAVLIVFLRYAKISYPLRLLSLSLSLEPTVTMPRLTANQLSYTSLLSLSLSLSALHQILLFRALKQKQHFTFHHRICLKDQLYWAERWTSNQNTLHPPSSRMRLKTARSCKRRYLGPCCLFLRSRTFPLPSSSSTRGLSPWPFTSFPA